MKRPQPQVSLQETSGEEQQRLYAHLSQSRRAAEVLRVVLETEQVEAASVSLTAVVAGLASDDV